MKGEPAIPPKLCDFVDWVAKYTLSPPGMILAMVLRGGRAFEPEAMRIAYVRGGRRRKKMTPARERVLGIAEDGLARSVPALAQEANVSRRRGARLIEAGALVATELPEFAAFPIPDPHADGARN